MPDPIFARQRQIVGTTADWGAHDLVLGAGELALERASDGSVKARVGDGFKPYSESPYLGFGVASFNYRGNTDPTAPPPSGAAPGDIYTADPGGVVDDAWGEPAAGEVVDPGDYLTMDADGNWHVQPGGGDLSGFVEDAELIAPGGAALVGFIQAGAGAVPRTAQGKMREHVSVLDYGADPTGVLDSTAAFNLATRASEVWSEEISLRAIYIPSGKYKLDGTVYVRLGQTLYGDGFGSYVDCSAATTPVFKVGWGATSGAAGIPGVDPGGSPPVLCHFRTLGGTPGPTIDVESVAGFSLHNLFIGWPDNGIRLKDSGDGIIDAILIDSGQQAITISGGGNHVFTNINCYLSTYAFTFSGAVRDVIVSGFNIEYPRYAAAYLHDSASNCRNIIFSGGTIKYNEQFATSVGAVHSRGFDSQLKFVGVTFRNWKDYCINQPAGTGCAFDFDACEFNAQRTSEGYAQSVTGSVLNALNAKVTMSDCWFRNLLGYIANLGAVVPSFSLTGGGLDNCTNEDRIITVTGDGQAADIRVKDVRNFGFVKNTATHQAIVLPYFGGRTSWRVAVAGCIAAGASSKYGAFEDSIFSVTYQYDGSVQQHWLDKILRWKSPTRTIPGDLNAAGCFGTAPGGAVVAPGANYNGKLCISVPVATANAALFRWEVETVA
jgi:hypothetical protein